MPWYVVRTPQGDRQVFAETPQQAATIVFQQTGVTVPPPTSSFPDPVAGVQMLAVGSGGSAANQLQQPGGAPNPIGSPAVNQQTGGGLTGQPLAVNQQAGGGLTGATDPSLGTSLESIDPFAAFLRTFQSQLGPLQGTLAQRQLESRAGPAAAAFTGGELLRAAQDPSAVAPNFGDESAFANFLASQGIGANFRGQAGQTFRDLGGLASQRAAARGGAGPINDPILQQILNPTGEMGSDIAQTVSGLGEQAFRSRFSPFVANRLSSGPLFDTGRQLSEFRAQTGEQGMGDFVTFLRNRFGLGF